MTEQDKIDLDTDSIMHQIDSLLVRKAFKEVQEIALYAVEQRMEAIDFLEEQDRLKRMPKVHRVVT
jgi:hypothetical protein